MRTRWFAVVLSRIREYLRPIASLLAWHAIALHFFLIFLTVTPAWERMPEHAVSQVILFVSDYYADLTFNNRDFGFFAPAVYADWTLHLVGTTASGATTEYALPNARRELEVKYYSMIGRSAHEDARQEFARSWANWLMRQHAELVSVEVIVSRNVIPSMEEFRDGATIHEADEPEFRASFEREAS